MHLPYWPDNRPYTDSRKYFYIYVPADPPPAPDCRRTDRDNSSSSVFFRCPDPGTVSRPPLLCSYRYCTLQWLLHNPHNRLSSRNNNTACIFVCQKIPRASFFRYIHYEYTVPAGGPLSNISLGFLHTVSLYKYVLPLPDLSAKKESAYTQWCCHPGHTTHNSGLLRRL